MCPFLMYDTFICNQCNEEQMNQEDKEALKDFLSGVATVFAVLAIFVAVIAVLGWSVEPTKHKQEKQETEVVGHYKECDVVRYTNSDFAQNKYFIYCPK
jgi:Na+-transporting methylmalonyl-CoA/oxaloacetate decarboxylase gamma subunit